MKTLISGWSAVTGLTTSTGNTCNDINRKTKDRGRTMLQHHLPLLQHVAARCLCALPNGPAENARSFLKSRGKRKVCRWPNPVCPRTDARSPYSLWSTTLEKRRCSFKGKKNERFREDRQHKRMVSPLSYNFPPALLSKTCGSHAPRFFHYSTVESVFTSPDFGRHNRNQPDFFSLKYKTIYQILYLGNTF